MEAKSLSVMNQLESFNSDDIDIYAELGVMETKHSHSQHQYTDPLDAFIEDEPESIDVEDLLLTLAQEELKSSKNLTNSLPSSTMIVDYETLQIQKDRDAYHLLLELRSDSGEVIRPFATVIHRDNEIIALSSPKRLPDHWKRFFSQLLEIFQSIMKKQFAPSI